MSIEGVTGEITFIQRCVGPVPCTLINPEMGEVLRFMRADSGLYVLIPEGFSAAQICLEISRRAPRLDMTKVGFSNKELEQTKALIRKANVDAARARGLSYVP